MVATFESLNDDTLTTTLKFVGDKSYRSFGGTNKRCKEVYIASGMEKKTFLFGYAPLSRVINKIEESATEDYRYETDLYEGLCKGVVFFNRRDVLGWALEERKDRVLNGICDVAAEEGRTDLLEEVWNNVEDDEDNKQYIFEGADHSAARFGKLNVLKWLDIKGLLIHKKMCAKTSACEGHLHILQWLIEELTGELYRQAIECDQLNVMKWLREKEVPFCEYTFPYAAEYTINLDILQWLHDEGCPWKRRYSVRERSLKPEVIDWCRVNGYGDRIEFED